MSGTPYSAKELLARLVAFDTTSHRSNLPLVDFVEDYLTSYGVSATRVHDDTGEKAALFATIGAEAPGGVVLSAHTDVVPVDGQPWTSDPFTMTERAGRLYGRGTTDMKGFVACCLAMVPDFVAADLRRPVHLALSYDEEVGCLGVRPLARAMVDHVAPPSAVIVGEPTSMQPVDAHKSAYSIETVVTGREAHSSVPAWGVNAIVYAARFVGELERLAERLRATPDPAGRFDPAYSTLGIGRIEGGTAHNIVPRQCRVVWGLRGLPGVDVPGLIDGMRSYAQDVLMPEMQRVAPEAGISVSVLSDVISLNPDPGSPAETLVKRLARDNSVGAVSYATDGGYFQNKGWPTVVCGPGDIEQAHKPDEYIDEADLHACTAFLGRLADELAA